MLTLGAALELLTQDARWSRSNCFHIFVRKTLSTFVWQFPHLFERRPDWLVVMWSASNVMVLPKAGQANTFKSGWRTIRPVIVKLLTALLQVDSF